MPKNPSNEKSSPEIASMFRQSIAPYSKKLVALHPHLYGSLYRRASEIQALDKILQHLKAAEEQSKVHHYAALPSILDSIKDALHGHPPLSWWNLFTTSLGYAFGKSSDSAKNAEEAKYLSSISQILTEIIRNYQSPNTKLLLDIRLTALEVDARLLEIENIPEGNQEVNETLEYLVSEFKLLTGELNKIIKHPKDHRQQDTTLLLTYIKKVNRLLVIAENIQQTEPSTYSTFIQQGHQETLTKSAKTFVKEFILRGNTPISSWTEEQINSLFELFIHCHEIIFEVSTTDLYNLLNQSDIYFLANPKLNKVRHPIFFSNLLKKYMIHQSKTCQERFEFLRAIAKGIKTDPNISKDPTTYHKNYLIAENDLHHICNFIQLQPKDTLQPLQDPTAIQKEILNRLIMLSNVSRPKDLDFILKTFSEEEKEGRYFLIQEIILEQFIRWRKLGIY
ncbi:MAG: hypothetical protein ACXWM7_01605 [Parachlamydiaceae bacterium]